jgi:hypothetical protein
MQRENLTLHVEEMTRGNIDQAARHYTRVYLLTERTDQKKSRRQAKNRQWLEAVQSHNSPYRLRTLAQLSADMLTVVLENHLRPRMDILLFVRGVVEVGATIRLCGNISTYFRNCSGFLRSTGRALPARLSSEPLLPALVELATKSDSRLNEITEGILAGRFEVNATLFECPWTARPRTGAPSGSYWAWWGIPLWRQRECAAAP